MPYNENWPTWFKSSITKFLDDNKGSNHFFFEGQQRKTNAASEYFEIRFNGPNDREQTKNRFHLEVTINILCVCQVEKDLFKINRLMGFAAKLLHGNIPLYDTDGNQLGCLTQLRTNKWDDKLREYGLIKQPNQGIHGTVETTYYIELDGT